MSFETSFCVVTYKSNLPLKVERPNFAAQLFSPVFKLELIRKSNFYVRVVVRSFAPSTLLSTGFRVNGFRFSSVRGEEAA